MALSFAKQVTTGDDLQCSLFRFEIDTRLQNSKPFASIRSLSYYAAEDEVLIMLGTIFQVKAVNFDQKQNIWVANLMLSFDDEFGSEVTFEIWEKDTAGNPHLNHLARPLGHMDEYEKGRRVVLQVLSESSGEYEMSYCYLLLGEAGRSLRNYETALENYFGSLALNSNPLFIGQIYSGLADVCLQKGDTDLSLKYSQKALDTSGVSRIFRALGRFPADLFWLLGNRG